MSKLPHRHIVQTAEVLVSARYAMEAQQEGDFWIGRVILRTGPVGRPQIEGHAVMATPERAIAAALISAGQAMLEIHPREGDPA